MAPKQFKKIIPAVSKLNILFAIIIWRSDLHLIFEISRNNLINFEKRYNFINYFKHY